MTESAHGGARGVAGDGPAGDAADDPIFAGPGRMRERCRAMDWATTSLGPPASWSPVYRAAVRLMLATPVATCLWTGPDYTLVYNDAYAPILGAKDPTALGRSGVEVWDEVWPVLQTQFETIRAGGDAVFVEEMPLVMERLEGGAAEDTWFTYSLSALTDERGDCLAVYNLGIEITEKIRAREAHAAAAALLQDQQVELELANQQMQETSVELEALNDELVKRAIESTAAARRGRFAGDVGIAITVGTSLSDAMQRCCQAAVDHLGAAFARVWVLDRAEPVLVLTASAGIYTHLDGPHGRVPVGQFKIGQIAAERRAHQTNAVIGDPRVNQEWARREGMVSFAGYPLLVGDTLMGVMGVFARHPLGVADFDALGTAATAISVAIDGAHHIEAERLAREAAERLNQQLQESAAELEMQAEELQESTTMLEERTREAEQARRVAEEERLRATSVLEGMADAHFALDRDFRIIATNPAMERGSGSRRDEMLGRTIWEAFPGTVGTQFERAYRQVATQRTEAHFVHDYTDGRLELVVDVDAYPGPDGGVAVFWRDVTRREQDQAERARLVADLTAERERLESVLEDTERARAEAEAARAEADAANRAKGEFLAVMSHELRTPLNAIGGYAELLELGLRGPVTEEQRADLARIQQSQKHLLGLINQVLNYTRVETGTVRYDVVDVVVADALSAAEALVVPQVRSRGLTYVVGGCDPALGVRADREKLQQILLNLLTNAIKFTEGGGRITVSCLPQDANVAIAVRDTGVGIAADKLATIFEPFVQVDQRLTRPHEGVGLGLAISRDLARGMDGDLSATSAPGEGSTFTLTLPRVVRRAS